MFDHESVDRSRLEEAMYAQDDVRRHPDGSVDFDFYRRRTARLRSQAVREFFRTKVVPSTRAIVAVVAIAAALYLTPSADGAGWNGAKPTCNAAIPHDTVVAGKS
jgi:hypothetical protein